MAETKEHVQVVAQVGVRYEKVMPHSEVCMHMRVAGKKMLAELVRSESGYVSAQLYRLDGSRFSSSVTTGEAGFYYNHSDDSYYFYPELG
jgi:hypothetical protein